MEDAPSVSGGGRYRLKIDNKFRHVVKEFMSRQAVSEVLRPFACSSVANVTSMVALM